jgi:anti-sigma factor (TIGR02949 family)
MTHQHDLNCQDILHNLNDYIDGELDRQLCADIEAHIDSCPDCRVVVNTLKKTIQLYQISGQETELPEDVRQRLYARLDLDAYARKK